jgi:hypothetical protein
MYRKAVKTFQINQFAILQLESTASEALPAAHLVGPSNERGACRLAVMPLSESSSPRVPLNVCLLSGLQPLRQIYGLNVDFASNGSSLVIFAGWFSIRYPSHPPHHHRTDSCVDESRRPPPRIVSGPVIVLARYAATLCCLRLGERARGRHPWL